MNILRIVRGRAERLIRQFHQGTIPPILAHDLKDAGLQAVHAGGRVEPLAGVLDAWVWRFPADPWRSSVWVPGWRENYKAAYLAFLRVVHNVDATDLPMGYDVDHIYNRAGAAPHNLIRVEAVQSGVNRSHGAGFEKRASGSPITAARIARSGQIRNLSFVSVLKLAGIASPLVGSARNAKDRREKIISYLTQNGWTREEIAVGLNNLEEAADRRAGV